MSPHTLDEVYSWLLYTCALGQIFFVILWSTVKWWKTRVGRALFAKSISLAFALSVVSFFDITNYHYTVSTFYKVYITTFTIMFVGILYQDLAMFFELRDSKREREENEA